MLQDAGPLPVMDISGLFCLYFLDFSPTNSPCCTGEAVFLSSSAHWLPHCLSWPCALQFPLSCSLDPGLFCALRINVWRWYLCSVCPFGAFCQLLDSCLCDRTVLILFDSTLHLIAFHHSLVWPPSAGNLIFNSVFIVWKLFVFIFSHSDVSTDVISAVWCLNKYSGVGFYCETMINIFYLHVN